MKYTLETDLTVAVLAGGKSRRFGRSKFWVKFNNRTLIDIALEIAFQISGRVLVIRGKEELFLPQPMESVVDKLPDQGPLGGIYTALFYIKTNFLAVMPADMPLLSPMLYKHLFKECEGRRPVIAVSSQGWEPLVSIWPKKSLTRIENFLKEGKLSLRHCLRSLNAIEVEVLKKYPEIPAECFYNVNTKKDLNELIKIVKVLKNSKT